MIKLQETKLSLLALLFSLSANADIDVDQSVLNMKVKSDGIYRVSYDDIIALGIDLSGVLAYQLAVYNNGDLIPAKVHTINESTFDTGSFIEFVGFADNNIYQNGSVYSLVLKQGSQITDKNTDYDDNQAADGFYYQSDIYAENTDYSTGSPIDDPWFAKRLLAIGAPASDTIDFNLDQLVNVGTVDIELNIWGGTDYIQSPDHHVIYQLNGNDLDDFWFDGVTADTRNYEVAASGLSNGNQQITITAPNDTNTQADVIHVESWKVTYPRAYVMNNQQIDYAINANQSQSGNGDIIFANGFETSANNFLVQNHL